MRFDRTKIILAAILCFVCIAGAPGAITMEIFPQAVGFTPHQPPFSRDARVCDGAIETRRARVLQQNHDETVPCKKQMTMNSNIGIKVIDQKRILWVALSFAVSRGKANP